MVLICILRLYYGFPTLREPHALEMEELSIAIFLC